MAIQDYPTEPLYRRDHNSIARRTPTDLDKGTLWAGAMLCASLLVLIAYMLIAGPTT
jgi:hypothetical protein